MLRKVEKRGTHETAHRVKQRVGQIFRFGIGTRQAARDITQDLRGALAPVVTKNHAAIVDPQGIAPLLRSIDGYQGQPVTAVALKLAPLLFVCSRAGIQSHSARYAFARERMQAYRDQGYSEREARAATSLDLGHGDGRRC